MTDITRNMAMKAIQANKELALENTQLKTLCKELIKACDTISLKSIVIRPFLKIFKKHADLIATHRLHEE